MFGSIIPAIVGVPTINRTSGISELLCTYYAYVATGQAFGGSLKCTSGVLAVPVRLWPTPTLHETRDRSPVDGGADLIRTQLF